MPDDLFGNTLETLGDSVVKPVVKSVQNQTQVGKTGQTIATQVTGDQTVQQQKDTQDINKALYGKSEDPKQAGNQQPQDPTQPQDPQAKAAEEQKKMEETRKKLQFHMEHYYKPTFEAKKKPDETVQDQHEKDEQEKKAKEQQELVEQKKKEPIKPPITKGSGEKKLGIGG